MTRDAAPILIVGAGPTGLMLACELARHGAPARIVEKLPAIVPTCRAKGVHCPAFASTSIACSSPRGANAKHR